MADALAQNIDIIDYSTAMPMPNASIAQDSDNSFSTLMTNVSNKVEETQSKFVDKAAQKSNTSSINRFALKNQTSQKNVKNQIQTQNLKTNQTSGQTTAQNTVQNTVQTLKSQDVQTDTAIQTAPNQSLNTNQTQVQAPVNNTGAISQDVECDSLEPSPLSLNESNAVLNNNLKAQISNVDDTNDEISDNLAQEIKTIVENILITFDIPLSDLSEDKTIDIENAFSNLGDSDIQNYDYIIKAIDDISSQLNNLDLAQESKDKISAMLDKIKAMVQNAQKNITVDTVTKDAKNLLDGIILKVVSSSDTNTSANTTPVISNDDITALQKQAQILP
ncbi:hypothetical protein IJ531_00150, partial [bacterium]|nr:hypothetical protein [bacterium]